MTFLVLTACSKPDPVSADRTPTSSKRSPSIVTAAENQVKGPFQGASRQPSPSRRSKRSFVCAPIASASAGSISSAISTTRSRS